MGVDQLVTGGDVDDPIVDSLIAGEATLDDSQLYIRDTEPTDGETGDVWIDTS